MTIPVRLNIPEESVCSVVLGRNVSGEGVACLGLSKTEIFYEEKYIKDPSREQITRIIRK